MKRDLPIVSLPSESLAGDEWRRWRLSLSLLVVSLAWICSWYAPTAAVMVNTWATSETYAHGFVVLPIALWLVWRLRDRVMRLRPHPDWRPLPFVALIGFAWLAAKLGTVNVVAQAAFVAMLILTVPALLGAAVTRALLFPLGFLFFCVPVGEFLLPTLMEHTANFTVAALRATGVPVYREGLQLVIPTGRWSIVEACSGVRYLIASVMVGTLFAYLNYRSWLRRLTFVGVSIAVPIVANWVRAYMIVMLGHLTNNRLAVGVDHVIYGWVFFGVVMVLMFWIGSWWRESDDSNTSTPLAAAEAADEGRGANRFFYVTALVMALTVIWPLADLRAESSVSRSPVHLTLQPASGWSATQATAPPLEPRFSSPSATLHEQLERNPLRVGLYIAFYRDQGFDRKLVSSDNKLVSSQDAVWNIVRGAELDVPIDGSRPVTMTRLQARDGSRLMVLKWYWIDGVVTSSDVLAKAATAWSRLLGRGDDSAAIVVYARDVGTADTANDLRGFVRDNWPNIASALQRARNDR